MVLLDITNNFSGTQSVSLKYDNFEQPWWDNKTLILR